MQNLKAGSKEWSCSQKKQYSFVCISFSAAEPNSHFVLNAKPSTFVIILGNEVVFVNLECKLLGENQNELQIE